MYTGQEASHLTNCSLSGNTHTHIHTHMHAHRERERESDVITEVYHPQTFISGKIKGLNCRCTEAEPI